jgi:hypothetical protein
MKKKSSTKVGAMKDYGFNMHAQYPKKKLASKSMVKKLKKK